MVRICIFLAAFLTMILQAAAANEETPATPKNRTSPPYPAACMPASGVAPDRQTVTVIFTVNRDGQTEDVRVRESSDECFNETAIAAARGWSYEPRRVNGSRQAQTDMETTFTFVFDGQTTTEDYDARPSYRAPPQYPEKCMRSAKSKESLLIEFDVTESGSTENIRIVESTHKCLDSSAIAAVSKWRYHPKTVSGVAVRRNGVQTILIYNLSSGFSNKDEYQVRDALVRRFDRVQKKLRFKKDADEILTELAEIESEYGDSFSKAELTIFHQFRAAARIEVGDYRGALDDLRVVQQTGVNEDRYEAVASMIEQLEAVIASQDAAAASAEQSEDNDGAEQ